jgi:hypothetical protein
VVYGVPEEVLTDTGKVFTGRFHKPGVPVEVLFDRICRENGISHRLTKIHSPSPAEGTCSRSATLRDQMRGTGMDAVERAVERIRAASVCIACVPGSFLKRWCR